MALTRAVRREARTRRAGWASACVCGIVFAVAIAVGGVSDATAAQPSQRVVLDVGSPLPPLFAVTVRIGGRAGGRVVVARATVFMSGLGVACGTCSGDDESVFAPKLGGRVFVVLTRQPECANRPPGLGPLVVAASKSGDGARYIDLPAGTWNIVTTFPRGSLRPGSWTICAWVQFDPAIPVSNPTFPRLPPGLTIPTGFQGPFGTSARVRVPG